MTPTELAQLPKYRIVTPEQLNDGYLRRIGARVSHHPFVPIEKLPDGNWVVLEPKEKP